MKPKAKALSEKQVEKLIQKHVSDLEQARTASPSGEHNAFHPEASNSLPASSSRTEKTAAFHSASDLQVEQLGGPDHQSTPKKQTQSSDLSVVAYSSRASDHVSSALPLRSPPVSPMKSLATIVKNFEMSNPSPEVSVSKLCVWLIFYLILSPFSFPTHRIPRFEMSSLRWVLGFKRLMPGLSNSNRNQTHHRQLI